MFFVIFRYLTIGELEKMSMFQLQQQKALEPEELLPRRVYPQQSATVATAQTFDFQLPTDHFIHAILVAIGENTVAGVEEAGTLADDILNMSLILNGNNFVKELTGDMVKAVSILNKNLCATGYYKLFMTDPKIPQSKPIPAWLFSSAILRIVDNAPSASNYHHIHVKVIQSKRRDITGDWKLLYEKYLVWRKYGTNTLWQDYEHEKAYNILGYVYAMDDDGTLSNTIFDKLRIISQSVEGELRPFDQEYIPFLQEEDKMEYQNALPTGFVSVEFPSGLPSYKYSSLKSQVNIPTAGTNAGLRVVERFVL